MMQPQISHIPAMVFVGLEAAFVGALAPEPTNFKVIPPLWDQFMKRAHQVPNRIDTNMYGIIFSKPEAERSRPDELQYVAGVAVNLVAGLPEGMTSRTVPAGTLAIFTHRGPIANIGATVHEIYRIWLPQSAYRHAELADVELYDHRFCANSADSEMEYWISVTAKTTS